MQAIARIMLLCAVMLSITSSGCAPAYHDYADCHINCRYCPPPPLPYVHYPGCVCHSCAASKHLATALPSVETEASETDSSSTAH